MDCIFCKIISGDIPSKKVYEDDMIIAFHDINPEAKIHVLILPKAHIESADFINETNSIYVKHIFEKLPQIAKLAGITNGYRVITNAGADSRQSVMHLHFHVIGGEELPVNIK